MWAEVNPESMKETWAEALVGFDGATIAAALNACKSLPKSPNLPQFLALCRSSATARQPEHVEPDAPVIEKTKLVNLLSEAVGRMSASQQDGAKFTINGVPITPYKRWAYALILREADGEQLANEAAVAWREVLGFSRSATPQEAIKTKREIEHAE